MCTSSMHVHTDNQTDSESKTSHFYTTTLLLMCWSNMPTEQCKQYIHIYVCFVTTELLCRQSRVPKSQVELANLVIYLYDNRDTINQGHVFFFIVHFDLIHSSDGQLSNVSARPTVINWKKNGLKQFIVSIMKLNTTFHPLIPMLSSSIASGTLLLVI